jgi:hypothetical protein
MFKAPQMCLMCRVVKVVYRRGLFKVTAVPELLQSTVRTFQKLSGLSSQIESKHSKMFIAI